MAANKQAAPVVYKGDPRVVAKKLEAQADALAKTLRSLELENTQLKQRLEVAQMTFHMSQMVIDKLTPPATAALGPEGAPGSNNNSNSNSSSSSGTNVTCVNPAWSACAASLRQMDQYMGSVLGGLPVQSSLSSYPPEPLEAIRNLNLTPADVASRGANGHTFHFNMDPLRTLAANLARLDYSQCTGLGDLIAAKKRLQATRKDAALLLMCRLVAATPADAAAADAAIVRRVALDGHLNVAMVLLHPKEIYQVQYSNQATGAQGEVPPPEHTQALLSRMQLADWQAAQIAIIWRVYDQVSAPLLRACKDLQNQLASRSSSIPHVLGLQRADASDSATPSTAAASPPPPPQQQQQQQRKEGDSATAACPNSSGGSGSGAAGAPMRPPVVRSAASAVSEASGEYGGHCLPAVPQPHADRDLLEQLESTLRRLAWLNWCFAHLVACTLNAQQVAALFVFSHPYGVGVAMWAGYLAEHYPDIVPVTRELPGRSPAAAAPSQPAPHNASPHQQQLQGNQSPAPAAAAVAGQGGVPLGSGAWRQPAAVPPGAVWQQRGGTPAALAAGSPGLPLAPCSAYPLPHQHPPQQQQQQQQQFTGGCDVPPGSGWVPTQWPPHPQPQSPAGKQLPPPVLPQQQRPPWVQALPRQGAAGVAGVPLGGPSSWQGALAEAGLSEVINMLTSPEPFDFSSSGAWQQQLDALSDDQVAVLLAELEAAVGPGVGPN